MAVPMIKGRQAMGNGKSHRGVLKTASCKRCEARTAWRRASTRGASRNEKQSEGVVDEVASNHVLPDSDQRQQCSMHKTENTSRTKSTAQPPDMLQNASQILVLLPRPVPYNLTAKTSVHNPPPEWCLRVFSFSSFRRVVDSFFFPETKKGDRPCSIHTSGLTLRQSPTKPTKASLRGARSCGPDGRSPLPPCSLRVCRISIWEQPSA